MKLKCPGCGKVLAVPDTAAGKVVKCPCGKQLRAPAVATKPAAAPAQPKPVAARPAAASPAAPQQPAALASPAAAAASDVGSIFDDLTDKDLAPVKAVQQPGLQASTRSNPSKALQGFADDGKKRSGGSGSFNRATPGVRIIARIIDGIFAFVFGVIGGIAMVLIGGAPQEDAPPSLLPLTVCFCIAVIPYIINAVLIAKSGQSIGKKAMGVRIVDDETGQTAGLAQGFLARHVAFGVVAFVPLVALIDLIYLFGEDHRALHDRFAGTSVETVR